jgi:NADP-reducing hydrogenase subunit HndD
MAMVKITVNNREYEVDSGLNLLQACESIGVKIPTLCHLKKYTATGACRVCVVEVKGARSLCASCVYPVSEGMVVNTNSKKVLDARKSVVELILSNHSKDCLACVRNQNCELQTLTDSLGVRDIPFKGDQTNITKDNSAYALVRDTSKCVLCGRCVAVCEKVQGLGILGYTDRGFKTKVTPFMDKSFGDVNCMQCGQCLINCPTGALSEKEEIHNVIEALNDPAKHVIVQTAPAVRASLGEEFGMPIGTRVTGKMVAALKRMSFERVYDTNFGADLTIMEEGTEFLHRLTTGGVLPMITSCSPGWVRYAETEYGDILDHLSSCKSPHMMVGALVKSYYAQRYNIDPKDIYMVSIMPCTAKKIEKERPENLSHGMKDVDAVLTTRELGKMIKMFGIDFAALADEQFDQDLFGEYTGAGVIFGVTGGVMEAALRTVYELVEKKNLDDVNFHAVRGVEGLKEATIPVGGIDVKVAVAHSMSIAKPLLDDIRAGKSPYHFIEIMGCPGGCINGGGQSIIPSSIKNSIKDVNYKLLRAGALYEEDVIMTHRKSHENQQIKDLYDNFLGKPNGHLSHELLHTHYSAKPRLK